MKMNNIIKNLSMVSAIAVMVIVTAILAGCQKEKDDNSTYRVEIKEIDDSYSPIRLKSDTEVKEPVIAVPTFEVTSTSTTKSLKCGKTYTLRLKSTQSGFFSEIKVTTNAGNYILFQSGSVNYKDFTIIAEGNSNSDCFLTFKHNDGAHGNVTIFD